MDELRLRDKEVFPSNDILKTVLGKSFEAFEKLTEILSSHELVLEWNFYRDGNAWLCKILSKKKNLGWLHVYDSYFMVTCHFMERHSDKIKEASISDTVKEAYFNKNHTTKLWPMSITVNSDKLPDDILKMILFKQNLK